MKKISFRFPEKHFKTSFILDYHRRIYEKMSKEQKYIVRMAYRYGRGMK